MIQELSIENFLSFRDKVEFSFEATKDNAFEDYQVVEVAPNVRLLRFAIIFGANASGKSNVLKAFDFIKDFWFETHESVNEETGVIPFLLDRDTPHQPSKFQLKFWVDGIRYWYLLSLNEKYVENETLYYYKQNSHQPTKLFERTYVDGQSTIKFNSAAVKISNVALEELTLKCLPNVSFFVARNQVNISLPIIDAARDWMRDKMLPYIGPTTELFEYAGRRIFDDSSLKEYLLSFIHRADFNISEILSEKSEEKLPNGIAKLFLESEDDSIPMSIKDHIRETGSLPRLKTRFQHNVSNERGSETYVLPTSLQSEGTQRTIGIEAAIFEAIKLQAFLSIDEIESSLHPDLVEYIIEQFLKTQDKSQLLVTTHYDPLLNTVDDLLRKDSIWFTEKDHSGNSNLYSLVDFNGLNKLSSYQRSYRNGKFGALPNIR